MRKVTPLSLVVGAVLVFAVASASAQAPPPPPPYGPAITLEQAKKAMAGAASHLDRLSSLRICPRLARRHTQAAVGTPGAAAELLA